MERFYEICSLQQEIPSCFVRSLRKQLGKRIFEKFFKRTRFHGNLCQVLRGQHKECTEIPEKIDNRAIGKVEYLIIIAL